MHIFVCVYAFYVIFYAFLSLFTAYLSLLLHIYLSFTYYFSGAIEPQFYALFLKGLGLSADDLPAQMDQSEWPAMRERFTRAFASKSRDEWAAIFDGTDACVTPIIETGEIMDHKHAAGAKLIMS